MPRKIRQLKSDLRKAGFVLDKGRGKGSHTVWKHLEIPVSVAVSGHDGADAKSYQERDVREAIAQTERAK